MHCDGELGCKREVHRAPRLLVPHTLAPGRSLMLPRRMFTLLHFCEIHRVNCDEAALAQRLLTPTVKAAIEDVARRKWPSGYLCDFERARIEWLLVTTPEYRQYLAALGHDGIMGAAKLSAAEQFAERTRLGVRRLAG